MDDTQLTGFGDPAEATPHPPARAGHHPPPAADVVDLGEDAGAGTEDVRMDDMLTPFLRPIEKGSPQVDPAKAEYVEWMRPGMILNTATQETYPGQTGVEGVVCAREHHYGLWVPNQGPYRGSISRDDPRVREGIAKYGRFRPLPMTIENNGEYEDVEAIDTIQLYLLYAERDLSADNAQRAIISFTSTRLAAAQGWQTRHNSTLYPQPGGKRSPAALYLYRWRFALVPKQNGQNSWYVWRIDLLPEGRKMTEALLDRRDPLVAVAREFYQQFRGGAIKPAYDETRGDDEAPPF